MGRKKLIKPGETHGYIGDKPKTYKPPKVFIQSDFITEFRRQQYLVHRELYPESQNWIDEQGNFDEKLYRQFNPK